MPPTAPMPPPRTNPTESLALDRVTRGEQTGLWVSIEQRCGEQLLAAFLKCANATFTGR